MAYILGVFVILAAGIFFAILYVSHAYSTLAGSPFVPSSKNEVAHALAEVKLKKGSTFIDLGCGDGRVVMTAVKLYQVKGLGIDINPLLILYARFRAKRDNHNTAFMRQSIFEADIASMDTIFLFLMPKLINKLTPKLISEASKDTLIISHGFPIPALADKLDHKREARPFPTFFYRV